MLYSCDHLYLMNKYKKCYLSHTLSNTFCSASMAKSTSSLVIHMGGLIRRTWREKRCLCCAILWDHSKVISNIWQMLLITINNSIPHSEYSGIWNGHLIVLKTDQFGNDNTSLQSKQHCINAIKHHCSKYIHNRENTLHTWECNDKRCWKDHKKVSETRTPSLYLCFKRWWE